MVILFRLGSGGPCQKSTKYFGRGQPQRLYCMRSSSLIDGLATKRSSFSDHDDRRTVSGLIMIFPPSYSLFSSSEG